MGAVMMRMGDHERMAIPFDFHRRAGPYRRWVWRSASGRVR